MIRVLVGSLTILTITASANIAHAATTSPGKTAVYASTAAAVIGSPPASVLTATISKGVKKHVLEIDVSAVLTGGPVEVGALTLAPTVNGLSIAEPTDGGTTVSAITICVYGPEGCSLSLQYWVDLDAAEAANPGMFIKQPLVIDVKAGWGILPPPAPPGPPIPPDSGVVSLRARLQKK
jgi:hypothetical protein